MSVVKPKKKLFKKLFLLLTKPISHKKLQLKPKKILCLSSLRELVKTQPNKKPKNNHLHVSYNPEFRLQ